MNKIKLGKKIKLARIEADLTQQQFCKRLGTSAQTVVSWEKGIFLPKVEMLQKIAVVLGKPIDFFYGIEAQQEISYEKNLEAREFMSVGSQIAKARKEKNWTQAQLAAKLGQKTSAVGRWESGDRNPSPKNLEELALALGKDYKYFYNHNMNTVISFDKVLEVWHGGIKRGAQAELSRALNITTGMVAFWITGRQVPGEKNIFKMAELFSKSKEIKEAGLDVSVEGLKKMFGIPERKNWAGFEVVARGEEEDKQRVPILSAVYHSGEVVFFDDNEYSPSEENPMIAKIKITEELYAPVFYEGDMLIVDSRVKPEEGKVVLAKIDQRRVLGRIQRGALICLDNQKKVPLSSAKILGVAVKKETTRI